MTVIDLGPAAREVTRLLAGVRDEDLGAPTPCPAYPVAALLDHLMGLSLAFTLAARKDPLLEGLASPPGTSTAAALDPDWRRLLPERLDELTSAWHDPAAYEGLTEAGGVTMPSDVMATVALDEVVMHGWDLAVATGQDYVVDEAGLPVVLAFTQAAADPDQGSALRAGIFGPVVPVPADAPPFHRALGFAGRDPNWSPQSLGAGTGR